MPVGMAPELHSSAILWTWVRSTTSGVATAVITTPSLRVEGNGVDGDDVRGIVAGLVRETDPGDAITADIGGAVAAGAENGGQTDKRARGLGEGMSQSECTRDTSRCYERVRRIKAFEGSCLSKVPSGAELKAAPTAEPAA